MRVSLDWITVKLTQDFNIDTWRSVASTPLVSRETGEQVGIACPVKYWKYNRYAGEDYISAYGMGTNALAYYANVHDLRVSRIDVAVDVAVDGDYKAKLLEIREVISKHYESNGITISTGEFNGRIKRDKGSKTFTFGKQSSAYQIRLYARQDNNKRDGWVARCEFQLRAELARAFWQEARADYEDPLTLRNSTATLERTIFGLPLLGIGDLEQDNVLELPVKEQAHNTELWVRNTVLKACIRFFDETGINLPQLLVEDFNKHITSRSVELNNDSFSTSDAENQFSTKSENPMSYLGPKRAQVALNKWFSDKDKDS